MSLASTEQLFIEWPLYRCFLRNDHLPFLLWNVIGLNNFPSFSCLLLLKISCLFQQKKWKKKGKYPDGVQIFTFLFDVTDFKRNLTDCNLIRKRVLKRIWCCSFHGLRNFAREWFLDGEHLTSSSTKTA